MKCRLLALSLFLAAPLWGAPAAPPQERWEIVSHTFVGIETRSLTPQERAAYGDRLRPRLGLLVTRVVPGSPADEAGMRAGDLLLHQSGCTLHSPASLLASMRNGDPGIPLHFTLLRGEEKLRMRVVPVARPEPVVVGYYTPHRLRADKLGEIRPLQAKVARLLAGEEPRFQAIREEMEAIAMLLCDSYSPGALRLHYSSGGCDISVARFWRRIVVEMREDGVEMRAELRKDEEKPLPEAMRRRLAEMGGL